MKIIVTPGNGPDIHLLLPTGLMLNHLTAGLAMKHLKRHGFHMTMEQATILIRALNCYRRKHPEWVLVEVQSADGDHVEVRV